MSARRVLSRTARALTWAVLLGALLVVGVAVGVPRLTGAQTYTVLTGSMRPDYPPGTLVVVRPVAARQLDVGDVVTYQLRPDRPEVVTHRVVAVTPGRHGRVSLQTRGDANDSPDPAWVRPVQVRGEVWYAVPYVGRVNQLLAPDVRALLVRLLAAALFGYAALMVGSTVRDAVGRRGAPVRPEQDGVDGAVAGA